MEQHLAPVTVPGKINREPLPGVTVDRLLVTGVLTCVGAIGYIAPPIASFFLFISL